jgi:hypothetical protein
MGKDAINIAVRKTIAGTDSSLKSSMASRCARSRSDDPRGLGGSITPNVERSATDAEPLGERDEVVPGIYSLDGVPSSP